MRVLRPRRVAVGGPFDGGDAGRDVALGGGPVETPQRDDGMRVGMMSDRVTFFNLSFDQIRCSGGAPADREEGRMGAGAL